MKFWKFDEQKQAQGTRKSCGLKMTNEGTTRKTTIISQAKARTHTELDRLSVCPLKS